MVQMVVPSRKSKMSKKLIFAVFLVGGFGIFNRNQWIFGILA